MARHEVCNAGRECTDWGVLLSAGVIGDNCLISEHGLRGERGYL